MSYSDDEDDSDYLGDDRSLAIGKYELHNLAEQGDEAGLRLLLGPSVSDDEAAAAAAAADSGADGSAPAAPPKVCAQKSKSCPIAPLLRCAHAATHRAVCAEA